MMKRNAPATTVRAIGYVGVSQVKAVCESLIELMEVVFIRHHYRRPGVNY